MSSLTPFLTGLWQAVERHPDARWAQALSHGQLKSKEWLIENANTVYRERAFSTAFVIGGWYGLLPALWRTQSLCPVKRFLSIDKDERCYEIAECINRQWVINDWMFKAVTEDAIVIDYSAPVLNTFKQNGEAVELRESPDLIINTCCEHFTDLGAWLKRIPEGKDVILQSNNFTSDPEHVGCVSSISEFIETVSLKDIFFSGALEGTEYTRYMIIGKT